MIKTDAARHARFVVLLGALVSMPCAALAQEEEAAPAPQEQPAARQIPWDTSCSQLARADEPNCEMSQMVIVPQSRQVLLRIEIEVPADGSGPRMVLRLPHGLYLPAGITLAIDEEGWTETEVQTCDAQGCYAGLELDAGALRRLQRGNQLAVAFQSLSRETVTVPVDLNGFTEAYGKIR